MTLGYFMQRERALAGQMLFSDEIAWIVPLLDVRRSQGYQNAPRHGLVLVLPICQHPDTECRGK